MSRSWIVALASSLLFVSCSKGPEGTTSAQGNAFAPSPSADADSGRSPDGEGQCGTAELPDCPLQSWMKANTLAAMRTGDFGRLEHALTRIASFAPDGYPGWRETALTGAAAASQHDLEQVRTSCKGCHDTHRKSYRAQLRTRPIQLR